MRLTEKYERTPIDFDDLPSLADHEEFIDQGLMLDHLGRPVHPWASSLPAANAIVGKGTFYHWGPNKTVDPIVITNEDSPRILLIRRKDTGEWALPGGFIDDEESVVHAAQRELYEETSVLLQGASWHACYTGPVDDPRSTLNAWPETTALITQIASLPAPTANDDALHAEWILLETLSTMDLYGSHRQLIDDGLRLISH